MRITIVPHLYKIYRKHLAQFLIFRLLRALMVIAFRCVYRLLSWVMNYPQSGKYRFLALNDCGKGIYQKKIVLDTGRGIEVPAPEFSGFCSENTQARNPAIKIDPLALNVFKFPKATVVGGVDFLFVKRVAIHHDLFVPILHKCPAENTGVVLINRTKENVTLYLTKKSKYVAKAVSLIGQCSRNYAHWLTETLPKLAVLDTCDEFSHWPLLVDDDLHPNMYASIDLINRNRREVIRVKRWEPVLLDQLVAVSQPGYERYAPHDIYSVSAPAYINVFSRFALKQLRKSAISGLEGGGLLFSKGIYLARSKESANLRQIENLNEVESVARSLGVKLIRPETMEFREQVAICRDAKIIVAPIGASLANMIFAPRGCKVIVLSSYCDEATYYYYTNLAGVLGHELRYVLGPQVGKKLHPIHRNYHIDTDTLKEVLEQAYKGIKFKVS